ncbi:MAG: DUF3570 domain-containing protein [Methyloglobulus sp.]|nr:DUF3570 domain-containing protein [Methyloglobulus sp.]
MAVIKNPLLKLNSHSSRDCRNGEVNHNLKGISKGENIANTIPLSLHALTAAALILPGLFQTTAHAADDDEVDFQYSHYQEGKRILGGIVNDLNAIEVDGLHGGAKVSLTDRIKFAFNYTQDTWGGATPRINMPVDGALPGTIASASPKIANFRNTIDADNNILNYVDTDPVDGHSIYAKQDTRWVHTLAVASPETRKQGDFKLSYQWDETALDVGGGISVENDYESRFGNLSLRQDFNQKQTSINLGLSYTNSDTTVALSQLDLKYIDSTFYKDQMDIIDDPLIPTRPKSATLKGNRQDWATTLGVTQILNQDALLEASMGYTRSTGYMANPYKAVLIEYIDPLQTPGLSGERTAVFMPVLEKRPDERNQWNWAMRYGQYIQPLDAALHLDYRFNHDDWGINAHTFEADWGQPVGNGWTITPRVRYYSQEAADFYQPVFVVNQAAPAVSFFNTPHDPTKYPANYSSDQRLSGYGALSGGVTVSKQFSKGVSMEAGFEYYSHAGSLKLGGGGEDKFADFNYYVANAALKVNLEALTNHDGIGSDSSDSNHYKHHHDLAPAGVLFSHMLTQADKFMVGYRYMRGSEAGDMLHGTDAVDDARVVSQGCPVDSAGGCRQTANGMTMNMHMLDLMYAPTDWLNLMLMPQFVDMEMTLRPLAGSLPYLGGGHVHGDPEASHGHTTGGVGDTGMYALIKLFDTPMHHIHLGMGLSAPTGDVGIRVRELSRKDLGFIHYGMQLGSGTWDFKPSLTYTGQAESWAWGGQLSGTKRLEDRNKSGYALGDLFQGTAWGSHSLTDWLSVSVRGVYTWQGTINHQYNRELPNGFISDPSSQCNRGDYMAQVDTNGDGEPDGPLILDVPAYQACLAQAAVDVPASNANEQQKQDSIQRSTPMDHPSNYGGHYVDVGFGLSATIPSGSLAGNKLSFEWLQPVYTDVNGYQLDRDGALAVNWNYAF